MAIVGITGGKRKFFPRLGKIRLGVKREGKGGSEYPQDTDHFVVEELPEVKKVYGEAPKALVVLFPSNDQADIFPIRLEAWRAGQQKGPDGKPKSKLWCNSTDGELATRMYSGDRDTQGHAVVMRMPVDERPDIGEAFTMPCPNEDCPHYLNNACKGVGRLNVVLPEVSISGVYQIETGSQFGRGNILDMLGWVRQMTDGHFAWRVPFLLTREPQNVTHDGKIFVKYMLTLRVIDDDERLRAIRIKVPAWLHQTSLLVAAPFERPEDLFPAERTRKALPPLPEDGNEPPDPLLALAEKAGVTPGQLEMLKARMRGDVGAITAYLNDTIKANAAKVAPAKPPAPSGAKAAPSAPAQATLAMPPPVEDEPPHPADDVDPMLGF